jgi:hypothetical protein
MNFARRSRDSLRQFRALAGLFKESFFLGLVAYADESGTHDPHGLQFGAEVAAVVGYLARKEHWERFTEQWNEVLERYEVPAFHMTEFTDPRGADKPDWPYKGWDRSKQDIFIRELVVAARDNTVLGIGGLVSVKDYDEVVPDWLKKETQHPYHFCLQSFFDNILVTLHDKLPLLLLPWEQVAFLFEQQKEFEPKAMELFHYIKEKRDGDNRMGTIAFVPKGQYRAHEAADLIAYRMRKVVTRLLAGKEPVTPDSWDEELNARQNLVIGYFARPNIETFVRAAISEREREGR